MTEALVLWVFMVLIQQQGMAGGAGATESSCEDSRAEVLAEAKAMGQQVLAASECQRITLTPVK